MPRENQAIAGGDMEIDRWIEPREVERITGKKRQSLANERHRGFGIPYYKVGASVRYKLSDVFEFMEQHRIDPETRRFLTSAGVDPEAGNDRQK
jgi:hypothetical protein